MRVSVVVPVYNAGAYLTPLLDSLAGQDLDAGSFEVIAVDDGSTDGSGDVLDAYAVRMDNLRVVHQANSGWPGQPRNRGLELSRGRYVFFADADDLLGSEALRRLVAFADRYQSDIVVPKQVGLGGRWTRVDVFRETQIVADLEMAFKTLGPTKLFRRSLLTEHGLRFPTGRVRLEDGMFVAEAYLRARRVSILADYDYYVVRLRAEGGHLTQLARDPEGYTWSVGEVARIVRELDPDPGRADRVVLDLVRRKCLKMYEPDRFLHRYPEAKQLAWIANHRAILDTHVPESLESELSSPYRERAAAIRTGDLDAVRANCRREAAQATDPAGSARAKGAP